MRLTSLALSTSAALLLSTGSLACSNPPAAEGTDSKDDSTSDSSGDADTGDDSPQIICVPGETRCLDDSTLEVCAATGLAWNQAPCEGYETCVSNHVDAEGETVAICLGPCEELEGGTPSSEGCSFYTTSMYMATSPEKPPDAIAIGNPQVDLDATVELRWVPFGSNKEELVTEIDGEPIENPVVIAPGTSHVFLLDPNYTIYQGEQETSLYRSGSVYHVVSNLPVVAYLHAPYQGDNSNGSTLLLPEHILQKDYVIFNHGAWQSPNYFIVIATQNQTTVKWHPPVETAGDFLPINFVEAGETGTQLLNRFDNIRIDTSQLLMRPKCEQDLSGTIIEADKPIWVVSAVRGLRLPWCGGSEVPGCQTIVDNACNRGSDFAMEQNLPLDYWGREYVGPHSPLRGNESHHWRLFAGEDDVTVTVTPPQPNTPIHLDTRGDWADLIVPAGIHLEFDGDGVFMPIQYVTGHHDEANGLGSPAMTQMVPTAQFLKRYVIMTGFKYDVHYVQVIRAAGNPDVEIDGEVITDWDSVGEWEISTLEVPEGPHELISDDAFGIVQYGYSEHIDSYYNSSGYAYMGGMKAEVIYVP
ncbi:MAG: IgGFc-binding protein [Enhygromyxa sp.]